MVSVPKIKTFPGKYFSSANEDETGLQSINRGPFCPLHLQYTGYVSVCHQPTQLQPFMLSLGVLGVVGTIGKGDFGFE